MEVEHPPLEGVDLEPVYEYNHGKGMRDEHEPGGA